MDCKNGGKMKWSNDVNAFRSDDVIYHILLGLSVKSLLRFKSVRKSWHALIESSDFIKEHLHYHHYDRPSLKRENHNLLFFRHNEYETSISFLVTSVDKFDAPTKYLQLDFPNLHEYFPTHVDVVIFNGIVCLHIDKLSSSPKATICLWNPATKQYRRLPQSPFSLTSQLENCYLSRVVGFGFDVKTNDYKVVKLIKIRYPEEKRVEVYSLSTDSWRSIDTLFPIDHLDSDQPKIPFNNGTCFCWSGWSGSTYQYIPWICCFDFSSEMFRSISFPNSDHHQKKGHLYVCSDKIACVFTMLGGDTYAEIWVFNDYGSVNECWAKLYNIDDPYSKLNRSMDSKWLSMDGNYIFFGYIDICRYNLVTEEIKYFSGTEFQQNLKPLRSPIVYNFVNVNVAEFKESLVSVGGGNDAPTCVKQA